MKHSSFFHHLFFALLCATTGARTDAEQMDVLDFREVPLGVAARAITEISGINVVPSSAASEVLVSLYLKNVSAEDALESLCRAHGFWHRADPGTGIIRIHTPEEYQRSLAGFREEVTAVFDLRYPNAHDIAKAVRDLYGTRVLVNLEDNIDRSAEELRQRFERFDQVDGRSQGIGFGEIGGSGGSGGGNGGSNGGGRTSNANRTGSGLGSGTGVLPPRQRADLETQRLEGLSAEEIQRLEATTQLDRDRAIKELVDDRADIFVNIIQRLNKVIVRTRDQATMDQIRKLIEKVDVPTQSVMLEVKIYSVSLTDGISSAVDYLFQDGNFSAGLGRGLASSGDFNFKFAGNSFSARIKVLEEKGRIRLVSAPNLLVANNEVSRLFVGEERQILRGFTAPTTVVNNSTVVTPGSPIYDTRPVGSTLLITPNINDDATLTLRILQENSEVKVGAANVLVPQGNGFINQQVDTVLARSVTGTVAARDRVPVVIGGLISTQSAETRAQVPFLGNLPGVGLLFGERGKRKSREELVMIICPRLVDAKEGGRTASRDYLKSNQSDPAPIEQLDGLPDDPGPLPPAPTSAKSPAQDAPAPPPSKKLRLGAPHRR